MKEFTIISECKKKARQKTARILDKYFWRTGSRTWRGEASVECIERVTSELRASASKSTCVCFYDNKRKSKSFSPVIKIGSMKLLSSDGLMSVKIGKNHLEQNHNKFIRAIYLSCSLAAMFHDFGKELNCFQDKLREAVKGKRGSTKGDIIRHEVFSLMMWDKITQGKSDQNIIRILLKPEEIDFDAVSKQISEAFTQALERAKNSKNWDALDSILAKTDFYKSQSDIFSLREAVGWLILTHHRLADIDETSSPSTPEIFTYSNRQDWEVINKIHPNLHDEKKGYFQIRNLSGAVWNKLAWKGRLVEICQKVDLNDLVSPVNSFLWSRTALIMADHVGSSAKISSGKGATGVTYANTTVNPDGGMSLADTIEDHILKVEKHLQGSLHALITSIDRYPGLEPDSIPESIKDHPSSHNEKFQWQHIASEKAKTVSESQEGGFFAIINSETGHGKTFAAPQILTAATINDKDVYKRNVRFNVALGLRTLTTQTAHEYVHNFGFKKSDIAYMIGNSENEEAIRKIIHKNNNSITHESGSEDRLTNLETLFVENLQNTTEDKDLSDEFLHSLSLNVDNALPYFVDELIMTDRNRTKIRKMLSTPILISTIDHLMPLVDGRRSNYIISALRTITSDTIIDEIDSFSPEDLSAICRFVYMIGSAGRRLIIMSATIKLSLAQILYDCYKEGYDRYASLFMKKNHVNFLVAGNVESSIISSIDENNFQKAFVASQNAMLTYIDQKDKTLIAKNIDIENLGSKKEIYQKILDESVSFHQKNHSVIEGFGVSIGLIRFTNIKNIFQFCKLTKNPEASKNTLFKFISLHSKYPQIIRKNIEHNLSIALNRKASDNQLAEFLRNYGILEEAKVIGALNIQVIILSSPVIETGNDLDFDWGIIDPNGEGVSRVIIQSGGRINRHRAKKVIHPNVGILSSALRTKIESDGKLKNPGIESHIKKENGPYKLESVFKCDLNGQNTIQDLFGFEVGTDEFKFIDKRLAIGEQHQHNRINSLEEEKLLYFLSCGVTDVSKYRRNQATQFSTLFPQLRQFRYSSTPQTQIYWNPLKDKFCLISDDTETSIKSTVETTQIEFIKDLYEFVNCEVPADKFKSVYYMNYEDYGRNSNWNSDRFLGLYNEKWLE